jgi:hypothetical protein
MVKEISRILGRALVVVIAAPQTGLAQSEAETVRSLLSGRTVIVTYRDGGLIYGTYQQIYVSFCPSGSYFSQGESSRTTWKTRSAARSATKAHGLSPSWGTWSWCNPGRFRDRSQRFWSISSLTAEFGRALELP